MAFTSNWLQAWYELPFERARYTPWSLMWFTWAGPIPGAFDFFQFGFDLTTFWGSTVGGLVNCPIGAGWQVVGQWYLNLPGGVLPGAIGDFGATTYNAGDCLPFTHSVVIRRETHANGRRFCGRLYVPGIDPAMVKDGALTDSAIVLWQGRANLLSLGFVSSGVIFTPMLVSYANGVGIEIQKHNVNGKLGIQHRRRGTKPFGYVPNFTAKVPPP